MLSAKNRIRLKAVQIPVEVDGVTINPGDLIAADDNGVISISSDNASEVLSRAISVESVERDIAFAVQHGESLEAAREKYGYATPWSRAKSL